MLKWLVMPVWRLNDREVTLRFKELADALNLKPYPFKLCVSGVSGVTWNFFLSTILSPTMGESERESVRQTERESERERLRETERELHNLLHMAADMYSNSCDATISFVVLKCFKLYL